MLWNFSIQKSFRLWVSSI